ncbi:MAG: haloacid dehalogenase-like hydrolase [Clostridia bacterium]
MKYIEQEKLKVIKFNKNNIYVAIDFDKTITDTKSDDSWDAIGKLLGEEFKQELSNLYQKYRPIELSYQIPFDEKKIAMEKWYKECMNLYYKYHLTKEKLEKSVEKSNLIFRKGAKEFLKEMYENNVPVIILSAGIGNTIELFLKENDSYYKNIFIISNFIRFDENGKMEKFEGQLIHSLNKSMEGNLPREIEAELESKIYRLLIGDAVEDKKMVPKEQWKNTVLTGFLNENIDDNLEEYRRNFDITLTSDDANFENVKEIVF